MTLKMPPAPYAPGYLREHWLADVVNANGFTRVAELGLWKGRTFLHLLCHCVQATVFGIDQWAHCPERDGIPGGETYAQWDMANLERHVRTTAKPFGQRARILKLDTVEAATRFLPGELDLIFIDADHSEAGVARDLAAWTSKVRPGGLITGHDIDWPTVKTSVERVFPAYHTGPDNIWWTPV